MPRRVSERHGSLPANQTILDELEGALTASRVIRRAAGPVAVSLRATEVLVEGEPLEVRARPDDPDIPLIAVLKGEAGGPPHALRLAPSADGVQRAVFAPPAAGGYTLSVTGMGSGASRVATVTAPLLVWPPDPTS